MLEFEDVFRAFKPHEYSYVTKEHVRVHLKNVYACLLICALAATAGAYLTLVNNFMMLGGGFLSSLVSIGLMMWLMSVPHTRENVGKRIAILSGFGFLSGTGLAPLLRLTVAVNPSIIPTALALSIVVFIGFSIAALTSEPGKYLYLGGICYSALFYMMIGSLLNIFIGSSLLFDIQLYLGLAVFCAFVLFDTQLIIEKRLRGDTDYIWHSVDLFIDFMSILKHVIVLLLKKEQGGEKKKRRD